MEEQTTKEAASAMRICRLAALRGARATQSPLPRIGRLADLVQDVLDRVEDRSLRNRLCARLLMVRTLASRQS